MGCSSRVRARLPAYADGRLLPARISDRWSRYQLKAQPPLRWASREGLITDMADKDRSAVPEVVDSPALRPQPSGRLARWMLRHQVQPVGPAASGGAFGTARVVEGDVPDRRRLLLQPRLRACDRGPGRRSRLPAGDPAHRGTDPAGDAAHVPAGGEGQPARGRVGGDAGGPAAVLVGQALRPGPARLRRHLVDHHHHPVHCGRLRPRGGKPLLPRRPARTRGRPHRGAAADPGRGLPARFQRGGPRGHPPGRRLPGPERGHHRRRPRPRVHHAGGRSRPGPTRSWKTEGASAT